MAIPYKYTAPIAEMNFALEVAGVNNPKYDAVHNIQSLRTGGDGLTMLSDAITPFAENVLREIYANPEHVKYEAKTQTVKLPDGYADAYKQYAELGILSTIAAEKDGGYGMPKAFGAAMAQILYAANNAFELTHALTKSVVAGLTENAKDAETGNPEGKISTKYRDAILRQLASGQSSGIMVMTESGAGSDLQPNVTTKATKNADGSYSVTGTKIFITSGDNEFATRENDKNIFHLTLVKIGNDEKLTLMAIPKFPIDENGRIKTEAELSDIEKQHKVYVSSIEEKTGLKHSATTTMQYENAVGFIVGERGKGMSAMFTVMNEARRAIGRQALGIAEIVSQFSFKHAQNLDELGRAQGKAVNGSESTGKTNDAIIVHPSTRKKLLKQRSFVEGARALDLMTELEADLPDEDSKKWVQLMTNLQKYHFTDQAFKMADHAIQVYGGSGYIEETGIAEFMRDVRVTRIYEGTNEIQAISLVGKQLPNFDVFEKKVRDLLGSFDDKKYTEMLSAGLDKLIAQKDYIQEHAKLDKNAGNAAAEDFMDLFGDVALGYAWAKTAQIAKNKLKENPNEADKLFYETKLATANFHNNVVLRESVHGKWPTTLEQLEIPDAGIRRQDVSPAAQLAATDLTKVGLPKGTSVEEVAAARVARINQDLSKVTESEKRDINRTLEQVKLDLGDSRRQEPLALQVKSIIDSPLTKGQVVAGSALAKLLETEIKNVIPFIMEDKNIKTPEVAKTAPITLIIADICKTAVYWKGIFPDLSGAEKDLYKDKILGLLYTEAEKAQVNNFLQEVEGSKRLPEYVVPLRHKYILGELKKFAKTDHEEKQVLILGSGYSTYAAMEKTGKYSNIKYYEVDFPEILDNKKNIYEKNHIDANATYIGCDYTKADFFDKLKNAGFDFKKDTLVIWEGNSMYLEDATFKNVTNEIFSHLKGKISVTFDSFSDALVKGNTILPHLTKFSETMKKRGHPYKLGFSETYVENLRKNTSTTWAEHLNLNDLCTRYKLGDHLEDGEHAAVSTIKRDALVR